MSIYVVIESIWLLFGDTSNEYHCFLYFVNQSFIICGVLLLLRGWINDLLISAVIGLNVVKVGFNAIVLINPSFAESVNQAFYVAFVIVLSLLCYLIINTIEK